MAQTTADSVLSAIRAILASAEGDDPNRRNPVDADLRALEAVRVAARPKCPECGDDLRDGPGGSPLRFDAKPDAGLEWLAYCDTCDGEVEVWA